VSIFRQSQTTIRWNNNSTTKQRHNYAIHDSSQSHQRLGGGHHAQPDLPDIDSLQKLGVRRLSAGSAIAQATLGLTERLARDFLTGSWSEMFAKPADYMTVNRLFDVIGK
jgi:hypothetical protein